MTKRELKMPATEARKRSYRLAILGANTSRCEKCLADCSGAGAVDLWLLSGLCESCEGKVAKKRR